MAKKKTVSQPIICSTKLIKKRSRKKKKRFLKNFVNYLTSDSYMYRPILSSQIIYSPPTTDACYETKKSVERNTNLLKKIVEYLKSDSFMYAPLFSPPPADSADDEPAVSSSHEEAADCPSKRVSSTEEVVVAAEIAKTVDQPVDKTVDGVGAHELWNDYAFERSSILRRTRVTKKRVFQDN